MKCPGIDFFRFSLYDKNMKKSLIFVTIIIVLAIISGGFYWFEYRPAKIRHDCSWKTEYISEKPADPGITKEEEEKSKVDVENCKKNIDDNNSSNQFNDLFKLANCEAKIKTHRDPKPLEPAREEIVQTNKDEYQFCLHNKGM